MAVESRDRREALIAEASVWMARLDAGQVDQREFDAWRDADPRRAAAFAEVAHTWNRLGVLRGHVETTQPEPQASPHLSRRAMLQAASVVGIAAVGTGLFAPRVFARNRASTGVGERRSLVLADGSRMELNTDTVVTWRLQRDLRKVWLERGQAALSVADDHARPFVLSASRIDTQLSPGQFDARLRDGTLDLTILSGRAQPQGRAAMEAAGGPRDVTGPSSLLITPARIVDRPLSDADVNITTSWRRGEIVFDGEPLATAVQEYNRYLTRKLVIGDRNLASLRLGGRFMTSNPDGFLTALNQAFGVRAVDSGQNQLLLTAEK